MQIIESYCASSEDSWNASTLHLNTYDKPETAYNIRKKHKDLDQWNQVNTKKLSI
jgi:uncharacterized caspase-like protein